MKPIRVKNENAYQALLNRPGAPKRPGKNRAAADAATMTKRKAGKRKEKPREANNRPVILQPKKPPNQTELRFKEEYLLPWLAQRIIDEIGEHESINLNLANGCDYLTDWPVWKGNQLMIYEVKGKKQWDDAIAKLKVAARQFKRITFYICKWDGK